MDIINQEDTNQPINIVPPTWDDETPHKLISEWEETPCWCKPQTHGKYLYHQSLFDAYTSQPKIPPSQPAKSTKPQKETHLK